jgi:sulfotransferase
MVNLILLGGLPRSGITLLSALLNRDPNIYTTTSSPFVEILWRVNGVWRDENYAGEMAGTAIGKIRQEVIAGLIDTYYGALTNKTTVIDKRRHWQSIPNIELYKDATGELPKIICPVRDVAEIMASFYRLGDTRRFNEIITDQTFGTVYHQLRDSYFSAYRDCIHFVEYNDLVDHTEDTLDSLYDFLELDPHPYDAAVPVTALEGEGDYGVPGLHTLRPTVSKTDMVLSDYLTEYQITECENMDFWRRTGEVIPLYPDLKVAVNG